MLEKVFERIQLPFPDNKIEIFTDGNKQYESLLGEYYAHTCMDYGQIIKIKEMGRVVEKVKRVAFGNPDLDDIETTNVENFNGILRERIGRLVRKTKCHSKEISRTEAALHLFQFHWNFMHQIRRGISPAMLEGLSDHRWTWHEFLFARYAV